jgi:hypothetical protein
MKTYLTLALVASMTAVLIGATSFATDSTFAGGHGHKKHYEKSQALAQANSCGNGKLPLNVFCSNSASQIQGDENGVSTSSSQAAD